MIDMDPRLDTKLRSLFEGIDAQYAPSSVTTFEAPARNPRHRANMFVAAIGATVVAVAIVIFGLEIGGHPSSTLPAPAGQAPLPTSAQLTSALPHGWHVVIPAESGSGSAALPVFTANGSVVLAYACVGGGELHVAIANERIAAGPTICDGTSGINTLTQYSIGGTAVGVTLTTKSSTHWVILVGESAVPVGTPVDLPALGQGLPADATILLPTTYGSGSAALPTFTPDPSDEFMFQSACAGAGKLTLSPPETAAAPNFPAVLYDAADCPQPGVVSAGYYSSTVPLSLSVSAPSAVTWELLVYELPSTQPYGPGPTPQPGATVLLPQTTGTGSLTLPAFTPTVTFIIVSSCSGGGSMTISLGDSTGTDTLGSLSCDQPPISPRTSELFAPLGRPLRISIDVPSTKTWSISVYQLAGKT